ncbi:type 2 isopentenyl-diphosphate Delta-isomerase [Peribacillus sp. SCS-155]|uniref:type 2 isopentenyl-diphosphate Delta-isomerase n=1 Tax=Peribacillus sedimenti TaxID=3115297 RepID=UPI0039060C38
MNEKPISLRKEEHIRISLEEDVTGHGITTGLEDYCFVHQALPELDFRELNLTTSFLGKQLKVPFIISSMTGGTERSLSINSNLAEIAEEKGWALALGSTRAALENTETAKTFQVRKLAPSIPIIANLGAVQLNYGYGVEECRRIIDLTEADALVLHLNSIQEIIQTGGNTNFKGLLHKIDVLCSSLDIPIGVKEVGWGIHSDLASVLIKMGVSFIDVAGAGGTSWSQVEMYRSNDPITRAAAEIFSGWGIPTADCIVGARLFSEKNIIIASGGISNGLEAAKALGLGANLAGFGRSILREAVQSADDLRSAFEVIELQLKMAMFGIGAGNIKELRGTPFLIKK